MSTQSFEITNDDLEEIEKMLQDDEDPIDILIQLRIAAKPIPVSQPNSLREHLKKRKERAGEPVRLRRG